MIPVLNLNMIDYFLVHELSKVDIFFMFCGIIGISLISSLLILKFKDIFLNKPYDTEIADFIPFENILPDNKTMLCSDGTLVRVLKLDGCQNSLANKKNVAKLFDLKKRFIDSLAEVDIDCRIITIRELEENKIKTHHNIPVLKEITDVWMKTNRLVFNNSYYIVISIENTKKAYEDISTATETIKSILDPYGVKLLNANDDFSNSNLITPFIKILNPISKPKFNISNNDLNGYFSNQLVSEEILFSKRGNIKFRYGEQEKYMSVIGIKNLSDSADEQMLSDILSLNYELNILQNFTSIPKSKAQVILTNQKRMSMAVSFSYDVVSQYDDALSAIEQSDTDHQTLTDFSQTIFVYGNSENELDNAVLEIMKIFRNYGFIPMRENWIAQASWFSQFPTYDKFPRTYRLLSKAVACLIDFNKQPTGFTNSDWAHEPITIFTTAQGTSYQFQFHVNDDEGAVGHTIAIGPTGQGKTTLYSFIASQAMRFDRLKTFFFDRHRGAEIFTYAVDGDYIGFESSKKQIKKADELEGSGRKVSLNPLKIEDYPENRTFLRNWLKEITLVNDTQSEAEIGRAITTIFDYLEPEKRSLKNIYKSVFSPTGQMRKEIERWVDVNQYGYLFNAENDTLNLTNRFNTFDFTNILDDSVLAPAVISYIMNRIQNLTGRTGDPSLIIIDETAPMLENPVFRHNFAIGLQEGRKKRQIYLAAFQQPNIIDKLGIGELIRGQAQTEIFFRNTQAVIDDYTNWNFTTKEYAFIKGDLYRDMKYAILFRKPSQNESVILNVDISGLGVYLQLFNSGRKNVLLAEEIRKKYNMNFVKYYLEQFKK